MHGAYSEERGNGGFCCIRIAVGEDEEVGAGFHRKICFFANALDGVFEPSFRIVDVKQALDFMHPEAVQLDVANFLHLCVGEHRMVQPQLAAVLRRFVQDIARAAQQRGQGHDRPFPNRVDGRVAHLGKLLPEVMR